MMSFEEWSEEFVECSVYFIDILLTQQRIAVHHYDAIFFNY